MKTLNEYFDATKAALGQRFDTELADWLAVSKQTLRDMRAGRSHIQPKQAARMGLLLNEDPFKIITADEIEHAKNEQEATFWKTTFREIYGIAASVLLIVGISFVSPTPAEANNGADLGGGHSVLCKLRQRNVSDYYRRVASSYLSTCVRPSDGQNDRERRYPQAMNFRTPKDALPESCLAAPPLLLPRAIFGMLISLGLGACASVGVDYQAPHTPDYPAWRGAADLDSGHSVPVADMAQWWAQYRDPTINALVAMALSGSSDLRTALARLDEVRARQGLAEAERMPAVDASASSLAQVTRPASRTVTTRSYAATVSASWEVDLFGGKRRALEAAVADVGAAEFNLAAVRISLIANVVSAYVDLRTNENRLTVLRETLASRDETDRITRWRAQAGLTSALEVAQSRTSLEQARAVLPAVELSIENSRNQLCVLLGKSPGELDAALRSAATLPAFESGIVVGIPAQTLQQRPDVRIAERQLAAATARTAEAQAQRYPKITLSGSIGAEALNANDLFRPESILASLAGGITAPIFDAGRISQSIAIQSAQQQQAIINWQGVVTQALAEVENALVAWRTTQTRLDSLDTALAAAAEAEQIARQQYAAGLIDLATVLDTQRSLYTIQEQHTQAQGERAKALITLYKSLGGGWNQAAAGDASAPDRSNHD